MRLPKLWRGLSPEGEGKVRQLLRQDAPFLSASGPGFRAAKMNQFSEVIAEGSPPALVTCNPVNYANFPMATRSSLTPSSPFLKRPFGKLAADEGETLVRLSGGAGSYPPCLGMGYGLAFFMPVFNAGGQYVMPLASWDGQRPMRRYNSFFNGEDLNRVEVEPSPFCGGLVTESLGGEDVQVGVIGAAFIEKDTWQAMLLGRRYLPSGAGAGLVSGSFPFVGTVVDAAERQAALEYWESLPIPARKELPGTPNIGVGICRVGPGDLVAMYGLLKRVPGDSDPLSVENSFTEFYLAVSSNNGASWQARTSSRYEIETGELPPDDETLYVLDNNCEARLRSLTGVRINASHAMLAYPFIRPGITDTDGWRTGFVVASLNLTTLSLSILDTYYTASDTEMHTKTCIGLQRVGGAILLQLMDRPYAASEGSYRVPMNGLIRVTTNGGGSWVERELPWASWRVGTITALSEERIAVPVYVEEDGDTPFVGDRLFVSDDLGETWEPSWRIGKTPPLTPSYSTAEPPLKSHNAVLAVRDSLGRELAPTPGAPWMSDSRFPAPWES